MDAIDRVTTLSPMAIGIADRAAGCEWLFSRRPAFASCRFGGVGDWILPGLRHNNLGLDTGVLFQQVQQMTAL